MGLIGVVRDGDYVKRFGGGGVVKFERGRVCDGDDGDVGEGVREVRVLVGVI